MNTSFHRGLRVLAALGLLAATCVHAQTTIDQTKALAGNVTSGDAPGFPVQLRVPGAYKLTSNLVVPAGTTGILIENYNVTIDLNGFSVIGPVVCTGAGAALTCTGSTEGFGIASSLRGSTVRNGTVRGFGNAGVAMNIDATIENVTARSNGRSGFALNGNSVISGSLAADNGEHGFYLNSGGKVFGSQAINNKGIGIYMNDSPSYGVSATGGEVRDSFVSRNGDAGIDIYGDARGSLIGNTASKNSYCFGSFGVLVRNNVCDGVPK